MSDEYETGVPPLTEAEYVEDVTPENDPDAVAEAELTAEAEALEAANEAAQDESESDDAPDPNLGE